ncbi:tyrosine-protein kinase STYK1b [Osmerus eperlanus]|uniref:tyrosine-protein kinase STYK1b n=1 Tax=Osmerus eperlanus TaxID=29151 RepID=UPI002E11BD5B
MSSSLSNADDICQPGNTICEVRVYEQEVIVVPVILLAGFLVTLIFIMLLRYCPEKVNRIRPQASRNAGRSQRNRRVLHGIDAPAGINPLEHESIALDIPNSYSTFPLRSTPNTHSSRTIAVPVGDLTLPSSPPPQSTTTTTISFPRTTQPRELPRQRLPESFNLVTTLPAAFSLRTDSVVTLCRARMEHRNVVLRVLNDSASASERQNFLGFASFLSQLGPHPFLPELLGVVSLRAPLVTVVEELENRDLLSFLWRCRQENASGEPSCEMTEKRIFTMATQVASALEFLHSRDLLHGNVRARNVLVSREMTAKLWGLNGVYTRKNRGANQREEPGMKKWQAPELLVKRPASQKSDVWSFGILMYEMATLGEAPFSDVSVNELLQFHQRGKMLRKPANCSNALYSTIKACCQWKEQDRASLDEVTRKLQSGEKSANDKALKVSEPINIEQYLEEAGYGDSNNYTVF